MTNLTSRRRVGDHLSAFELETVAHGRLSIPGTCLVHLQFRRFSGCPVCNVQVRRFSQAHEKLSAAGILTVSLFYSPPEAIMPYQRELPHPIVADPERRWFEVFGVERSRWAVANPRVWATAISGVLSGPSNPFEGGAQNGLPADFLIAAGATPESDASCQIVALKYGSTIDDQWSFDDVLRLAENHTTHTQSQARWSGTGRIVQRQEDVDAGK